MADLKEWLEKIKSEAEPLLAEAWESFSTRALPYLTDQKAQLTEALINRWRSTSKRQRLVAASGLLGLVAFLSSMIYLYQNSEFYARRQLGALQYELSVAGLTKACRQLDLPALDLFLQAQWPIDAIDADSTTALMSAAADGQSQCVRELIVRGGNPNLKNGHGESAVIHAIRSGSLDTVQAILAAKPDLNTLAQAGAATPLLAAFVKPDPKLIQALLEAGADPNQQDSQKRSPLFTAAALGDPSILALLLAKNAEPNQVDVEGMSPLSVAVTHHSRENVQTLLKAGAKPTPGTEGALSALHAAIDENQIEIVLDLLAAGANPNELSRAGLTPLIRAVAAANEPLVSALISKGANTNARVRLMSSDTNEAAPVSEEYSALDITYFMQNEEVPKIEQILKASGARAVISRTVRGGTRDLASLMMIEKILGPAAHFVRGRVVEVKMPDEFSAVHELLKKYHVPFNQFVVANIAGPSLLVTSDTTYQANDMVTLNALKWGSVETPLGPLPIYIESNRAGVLRKYHDALLKNSYSHFLSEWSDRIPSAYGIASKIKTGSGSSLSIDDLTLLAALLFGPSDLGSAAQVEHAARTASLCTIQSHTGFAPAQWTTELNKVLDFVVQSDPHLLVEYSTEKSPLRRKSAIQNEVCGTKDLRSRTGEVITFSQCMCGTYATAPVPAPGPEHIQKLTQIIAEHRGKLQAQAQVIREPASK